MPEKLSNQTIRHILKDIHQEVKELKEIAAKTNGRIRLLELWRARLAGSIAVIILLLVPIFLQYVSKLAWSYFK